MLSRSRTARDIEGIESESKSLSVNRIETRVEEVEGGMVVVVEILMTAHVEVATQGGVEEERPSNILTTVFWYQAFLPQVVGRT